MKYKFYKKEPTYDYNEIWEGYIFYHPLNQPLKVRQKRFQQIGIKTTLRKSARYSGWELCVTYIPDELIGKVEVI